MVRVISAEQLAAQLPELLDRFASDPEAEPVVVGRTEPIAVVLTHAMYVTLMDLLEDVVIAESIRARQAKDDGTRYSLEEVLARLGLDVPDE